MSNWEGMSRTNYVTIEDLDGLEESVSPFELEIAEDDSSPGKFCFITETEYGDWPFSGYDFETDTEVELSVDQHIMPFVKEGEVLVIMEAGHEKARYISGNASAYIRRGDSVDRVSLSLQDIYTRAAEKFNVPMESITPAEY